MWMPLLDSGRITLRISTKKITYMAMLTAVALIVFVIEAQIPLPFPIPGAKLGLANAVTLFALFVAPMGENGSKKSSPPAFLTGSDAFMILISRIILSAVFSGRFIAFIYSVAGGLLAFAAMVVSKRFVSGDQIWVCGSIGAIFHNVGQIIAAMFVTGTPAVALMLPQLIVIGVVSGVLTGYVAQFAVKRIGGR